MKKIAAAVTAAALVGGLSLIGATAPASAHTPAASATCSVLTVDASYYETKPGTEDVYESVLKTPAVEYQPAVYGPRPVITAAVAEVSHTEYEFRHKLLIWKTRWETNPNWNAESNENSLGWFKTGETRVVIDTPAVEEVLGDAPLISPEVLAQDAVYEDVLKSEGTPADDKPNNVFVEISGATVANDPFGTEYSNTFDFADPSVANDWVVTITAWNDPTGENGWTKTFYGTTTPCYQPGCDVVSGSDTIVGDGVLAVEGDWDSTSIAVPFSGTLADIGTVLDIDADPIQYVGLHIRTAEGDITFEEEPSYGGKLWSTSAWDGVNPGLGYAAFGTIEEFIHLNGDVAVTGIDLLYTHPEASSTTVESFTIGCTEFTFVPPVVVPEKPADVVTTDVSEDTDCEADEVVKTTTTTTVGTELVNNVWVPTEPVITTVTDTRAADDEECPPATTPPTATPTTPVPAAPAATPVTPAASSGLADTGFNSTPLIFLSAGALLIGAAISATVAVAGRRKSHR